jgi:hypothetical protein
MSFPIFFLIMVALTLLLLIGRRQFDELLRHLHEHRLEEWIAAGRPLGYFWRPEEDIAWIEGTQARSRLLRGWLVRSPDWMAGRLQWKLRLVRLSMVLSYLGFVLAGVSLMMSQGG